MDGWSDATIWIVLIVSVMIYNLYKLKVCGDPKEELLRAKQRLDEGVISQADHDTLKTKLLKRITSE